jgi:hypothetical protein
MCLFPQRTNSRRIKCARRCVLLRPAEQITLKVLRAPSLRRVREREGENNERCPYTLLAKVLIYVAAGIRRKYPPQSRIPLIYWTSECAFPRRAVGGHRVQRGGSPQHQIPLIMSSCATMETEMSNFNIMHQALICNLR